MISCEQVEVLREGLNYRPRPVFQSYTAYTPWLLQQNLLYYESPAAPQYVFARLQPIDSRYIPQEDGLLLSELPRRYSVVHRKKDYVLLHRKAVQPEHEQTRRLLTRRRATLEQDIPLPPENDCAIELRPVSTYSPRSCALLPGATRSSYYRAYRCKKSAIPLPDSTGDERVGFSHSSSAPVKSGFRRFCSGRGVSIGTFHSLRAAGRLEEELVSDRTRVLAIA